MRGSRSIEPRPLIGRSLDHLRHLEFKNGRTPGKVSAAGSANLREPLRVDPPPSKDTRALRLDLGVVGAPTGMFHPEPEPPPPLPRRSEDDIDVVERHRRPRSLEDLRSGQVGRRSSEVARVPGFGGLPLRSLLTTVKITVGQPALQKRLTSSPVPMGGAVTRLATDCTAMSDGHHPPPLSPGPPRSTPAPFSPGHHRRHWRKSPAPPFRNPDSTADLANFSSRSSSRISREH